MADLDLEQHQVVFRVAVIGAVGRRLTELLPFCAVFGGPALAEEWQSLSGASVLHVADPRSGDAMSIVKALAKALLRSSLRSTPPPPPTG